MDPAALALCLTAFDFGVIYADLALLEEKANAWDDKVITIADQLALSYAGQDDWLVALLHDADRQVSAMTGAELVDTIRDCEAMPAG